MQLPVKLGKEPLVDAIFGLEFESDQPVVDLLPGMLMQKLKESGVRPTVSHLPHSGIPREIRQQEPRLQKEPQIRLDFNDIFLVVGDKVLAVGAKIPYIGGVEFKKRVGQMLADVFSFNLITSIDRYSIKFINLIEGHREDNLIQNLNLNLKVGDFDPSRQGGNFQVKFEVDDDDLFSKVQVVNHVEITIDGKEGNKEGLLLSIETIDEGFQSKSSSEFIEKMPSYLDKVHLGNKNKFFSFLSHEGLKYLEAEYE